MSLGEVDRALAEANRAAREDRDSAMRQGIASRLHQVARRYDDAIDYGLRALQMNPDLPGFIRLSLAYAFWATKQAAPAVETVLRDPSIPVERRPALRALAEEQGLPALVRQLHEARVATSGRPCTDVLSVGATVLAFLGDADRAFECLERSRREGTPPAFMALDPVLDPIRGAPRFARLLGPERPPPRGS